MTEMDLNEYLWGVVAAEMPASFSQEALKAQAVAARTYALHRGPTQNHPDADLCTDYACCQAWIAKDTAQGNWGTTPWPTPIKSPPPWRTPATR